MLKIKFSIFVSLMAFFIVSITACTTTYLSMKNWEGRTVNDLYFEWGKPDKVESSTNNRTAHTWYFERTDDGLNKTCTKTFYSRNDGHGDIIVDTSYKDCLFLIAK